MVSASNNLFNDRFARNFFPIPAITTLGLGQIAPEFTLPDITYNRTVKLTEYRDKQLIILAFTRIFSAKVYCPLCYPHIVELNQKYSLFREQGVEILMITSTDSLQSQQVVQDLGLTLPLLSDPQCQVFRTYGVGQALGAPLPAQFLLDRYGKIYYQHLFSFLSPNASIAKLLTIISKLS